MTSYFIGIGWKPDLYSRKRVKQLQILVTYLEISVVFCIVIV